MTAVAVPLRPARAPHTRRGDARALREQRRERARERHLVVVDSSRRATRRRHRVALVGSLAVVAVFTIVAFHALLAQSQVAIDRIEQQTAEAERTYEQARYEHATLASPERIVARAAELGLVPPAGPPTAIPVVGEVPLPPEGTATTLHGWTDVKPTLESAP
jgi:cell division protein FtsL